MLLTRILWANRVWAGPFLSVLAPSERDDQGQGRRPPSLLDRARQAVQGARCWLPTRALVVVGDHTHAALEWLDAVRHPMGVITRLRLDAALGEPAPPRPPRQNGRPRKKGTRLPTLEKVYYGFTWQGLTYSEFPELPDTPKNCKYCEKKARGMPVKWTTGNSIIATGSLMGRRSISFWEGRIMR
jgi:hypothetical protein